LARVVWLSFNVGISKGLFFYFQFAMYMYYSFFRYLGSFCFPSFYYCKFPSSDAAGSRFVLLVCEIFGLGLVSSCGGDGGDVFSGCCWLVGSSVVLSLGLCLWLLWEMLVLVRSLVNMKRVMVWRVVLNNHVLKLFLDPNFLESRLIIFWIQEPWMIISTWPHNSWIAFNKNVKITCAYMFN
jgi:hypothetical protein